MTPVPLLVLGGYLGAGKTTLVNQLLRAAQGRRLAILVNDFGSISIDADLIEARDEDVLALAGGCVCCSIGADLLGAVQRLARRAPPPDVILLECSGVGLPGHVARSAALAPQVRVNGVVVVVDTAEIEARIHDRFVADTVRAQLDQADLLLLNHQDRCTPATAARVSARINEVAPQVPQLACAYAAVAADLLLGPPIRGASRPPGPPVGAWPARGGHTRLVRQLSSIEQRVDRPVDPRQCAQALVATSGAHRVLRAKGVVPGVDGRWWSIQVMGRRWEAEPLADTPSPRTGMIVSLVARHANVHLDTGAVSPDRPPGPGRTT